MELPAFDALDHRHRRHHSRGAFRWPSFPDLHWSDLDTLLPLVARVLPDRVQRSASRRRALLALRHDYAIDPNRELRGARSANIAIAVGHGFPSGGGLSQSLVNDEARARTPVAIVVCSAWMAVVLLFLTGLFERLPQPLLAALVLASVQGMFRIDELRQLRRVSTPEFVDRDGHDRRRARPGHPQGRARRVRSSRSRC